MVTEAGTAGLVVAATGNTAEASKTLTTATEHRGAAAAGGVVAVMENGRAESLVRPSCLQCLRIESGS
jgi:hypothetical protein